MLFQPATKGVVRYNVLSIERTLFPPKVPVLVTATVIAAAAFLPEDHQCWRIPRCLWLHRHKVTEVVKSLEHGTVIVSILQLFLQSCTKIVLFSVLALLECNRISFC